MSTIDRIRELAIAVMLLGAGQILLVAQIRDLRRQVRDLTRTRRLAIPGPVIPGPGLQIETTTRTDVEARESWQRTVNAMSVVAMQPDFGIVKQAPNGASRGAYRRWLRALKGSRP